MVGDMVYAHHSCQRMVAESEILAHHEKQRLVTMFAEYRAISQLRDRPIFEIYSSDRRIHS
jgi:hypothetical protein